MPAWHGLWNLLAIQFGRVVRSAIKAEAAADAGAGITRPDCPFPSPDQRRGPSHPALAAVLGMAHAGTHIARRALRSLGGHVPARPDTGIVTPLDHAVMVVQSAKRHGLSARTCDRESDQDVAGSRMPSPTQESVRLREHVVADGHTHEVQVAWPMIERLLDVRRLAGKRVS